MQPSLFTFGAPRVSAQHVTTLAAQLRGQGWLTAKQLKMYGWTDRHLRAVAHVSHGRVISGQRGYCLLQEATVDEARHAAAWLRHQGRAMIDRAREIEQAMHCH